MMSFKVMPKFIGRAGTNWSEFLYQERVQSKWYVDYLFSLLKKENYYVHMDLYPRVTSLLDSDIIEFMSGVVILGKKIGYSGWEHVTLLSIDLFTNDVHRKSPHIRSLYSEAVRQTLFIERLGRNTGKLSSIIVFCFANYTTKLNYREKSLA